MQHYLLTMDVVHGQLRMHGYLICDDKRLMESACGRIGDECEKLAKELGVRIVAPMMLVTTLSTNGKKVVREIFRRHSPEATEKIRRARDFHFTLWTWAVEDNSDDAQLMGLH